MTRICWRLADIVSGLLEPGERDAVRGDLVESGETGGQALLDVLGLVVRRQAALWRDWRPWLALAGLVAPAGMLLTLLSRRLADSNAVYLWLVVNNGELTYLENAGFRHDVARYSAGFFMACLALICWSWTSGLVLGALARRTIRVNGVLFGLVLLIGEFLRPPQYALGRHYGANAVVFSLPFYDVWYPLILQTVLVLLPSLWGMRQGLRLATLPRLPRTILWASAITTMTALANTGWIWVRFWWPLQPLLRIPPMQLALAGPVGYVVATGVWRRWPGTTGGHMPRASILLLMLAGVAAAADQPAVRATLYSAPERKPAPGFTLKDASGKSVKLADYRGKVVLLDFWATWCHGCKEEIPWFAEFQKRYGTKRFAVLGVSLDEGGWKIVKPFLASAHVPYRILLGDDPTAKSYGIETMPDTFLIDRQGRIAAAYRGLVDKDDVARNIHAILANERRR